MADTLDVVAMLREMLADAEKTQEQRADELDAARLRLVAAKEAHSIAKAETSRLTRAISTLESSTRPPGRPRDSGDPDGTRARIRAWLPLRDHWTGGQLRAVLAHDGHEVAANEVSAALASLKRAGFAVRVNKGWAAPPGEQCEHVSASQESE